MGHVFQRWHKRQQERRVLFNVNAYAIIYSEFIKVIKRIKKIESPQKRKLKALHYGGLLIKEQIKVLVNYFSYHSFAS